MNDELIPIDKYEIILSQRKDLICGYSAADIEKYILIRGRIMKLVTEEEEAYAVKALSTICTFLKRGYDISLSTLFSKNSKHTIRDEIIRKKRCIMVESSSVSSSIRMEVNSYLQDMERKKGSIASLRKSIQRIGEAKQHRYTPNYRIPVSALPEYLLYFAYTDGRSFEHDNDDVEVDTERNIPHKRSPESVHSYFNIHRLLNTYTENYKLLDQIEVGNAYNAFFMDRVLHILQIDNIFHFMDLYMLHKYYIKYSDDNYLDYLSLRLRMSYRQAINLKDKFRELVFRPDYISNIMESPRRLFSLYYFDVLFNMYLKTSYSCDSLSDLVNRAQEISLKYLYYPLPVIDKESEICGTENVNSAEACINTLKNNAFYRSFLPLGVIKEVSMDLINEVFEYVYSFEELKKHVHL